MGVSSHLDDETSSDMGLFMHMRENLGCDPLALTELGENILFFLMIGNRGPDVGVKMDFLVSEGLDPRAVTK
jgi:hypothetical protein